MTKQLKWHLVKNNLFAADVSLRVCGGLSEGCTTETYFLIDFHSLPSLGYTPKYEQLLLYKLRRMYSQLVRRAAGTVIKRSSQHVCVLCVSIHVQYVPPSVYCQLSTVNVKDSVHVFVCPLKRTMSIFLTRGGTLVQSSSPVKSADRYSSTDMGQRRSERRSSLVR